jgi:hypothetical protein
MSRVSRFGSPFVKVVKFGKLSYIPYDTLMQSLPLYNIFSIEHIIHYENHVLSYEMTV